MFPSRLIVNQKMAIAKRILIETESREIFIIHVNRKSSLIGFCSECGGEEGLLTLDEAVSLSGITTMELLKLLNDGSLHHLETESGHMLVCRESLNNCRTGMAK